MARVFTVLFPIHSLVSSSSSSPSATCPPALLSGASTQGLVFIALVWCLIASCLDPDTRTDPPPLSVCLSGHPLNRVTQGNSNYPFVHLT
ncbi:hypothetical protein E2C01_009007 [Portunus trituberculatus]|uniref:Uncharacterized protein n=1 Tax=Portunus trituberculatus TaxID=210409 RepID=A0A5B7D2A4_PORTR|nr:hypothetical protein [Portunus trituberculatus]